MTTKMAEAWETILEQLGYDARTEHLRETPERVERFMREWHTAGKGPPTVTTFRSDSDQLVAVGGLRFYSMCAHHGLPFFGEAAVGYIPNGRIAGLSKFARVVDHFARRFQVQEELTRDVAEFLDRSLAPVGLGVVMRAEHLCMSMRGIQRPGHTTITSDLRGAFRTRPEARAELLALVGG